jgi:RNA polymerase sigma factor (sigma-70 family)
MSDGQLLERFAAGPAESSELAFEVLVARHAPMVLRVCGNVLEDPHDVHDAFQAAFLVLARRFPAIRRRESVASWLYGVALRVASRARVAAVRRRIRDRRANKAVETSSVSGAALDPAAAFEQHESAQIVHEEVNKLPEKYRAPVVLCYLEGLTHGQAAARLKWPVGTVRSRLARARDALRGRLTRQGLAAPSALGPLANWLVDGATAPGSAIASLSTTLPAALHKELSTSLARAASNVAAGQAPAAASTSVATLALAQGVLGMMMLKKLAFALCVVLPALMFGLGGGALLVRRSFAQEKPALKEAPLQESGARALDSARRQEVDPLLRQLLVVAHKRLQTQRAYYEQGRLTLDRFIDACLEFELAQLLAAKDDTERSAVKSRYVELLREIEKRENAEVVVGRGTEGDVAEATQRRVRAELEFKTGRDLDSLWRRLSDLERKVEQLQKEQAKTPQPLRSNRGIRQ